MQARIASGPRAVAARYDRRLSRVVVSLSNGLDLAFPPEFAEGLDKAVPAELAAIEISPTGLGLHWPKLDADLYLPALLNGVFGSPKWMAALMGRRGGLSRTAAKVSASRINGQRGGRPRKVAGG
ncbi:MAG: DUF2442 domain-containing protein [Rhizomicrobium sp.]|jgi:hypothetical protein